MPACEFPGTLRLRLRRGQSIRAVSRLRQARPAASLHRRGAPARPAGDLGRRLQPARPDGTLPRAVSENVLLEAEDRVGRCTELRWPPARRHAALLPREPRLLHRRVSAQRTAARCDAADLRHSTPHIVVEIVAPARTAAASARSSWSRRTSLGRPRRCALRTRVGSAATRCGTTTSIAARWCPLATRGGILPQTRRHPSGADLGAEVRELYQRQVLPTGGSRRAAARPRSTYPPRTSRCFCRNHDQSANSGHGLRLRTSAAILPLHHAPEPLLAPPRGARWEVLFSTEDPAYGGAGTPPLATSPQLNLRRRS